VRKAVEVALLEVLHDGKDTVVLDLGEGVKLELVRIRAGTFQMGSSSDPNPKAFDGPPPVQLMPVAGPVQEVHQVRSPEHRVTISKPYYLGKFAVTRGQFARFVKETNYEVTHGGYGYDKSTKILGPGPRYGWWNTGFPQADEHPVVNVTRADAQAFCAWARKKTGQRLELPTESEWEYACRAGTRTRYFTGDAPDSLEEYANVGDQFLAEVEISGGPRHPLFRTVFDGHAFTAPVGSFKANPWGLHDMTGNVWQWCADGRRRYADGPVADPIGPDDDSIRVVRGGAWSEGPERCASSYRLVGRGHSYGADIGFRILLRPE
jgi:formylglycine-generating enzyme required for sulfatase activity